MSTPEKSPKPVDLIVGQNIRDRRRALGMSQSDVGNAVGTTFQQVQKYERGTNRVSCSMLVEIAVALDCAPAELLPASKEVTNINSDWMDDVRRLNDRAPNLIHKLSRLERRTLADLERVADAILRPLTGALADIGSADIEADLATQERSANPLMIEAA